MADAMTIQPVNFAISSGAWDEIENIKRAYDTGFDDKADALMIGWGRTVLHDGTTWNHVVVSFYGRSERSAVEANIQIVSGREVVFFVLDEDYMRFSGMTVQYDDDRGFFLSP